MMSQRRVCFGGGGRGGAGAEKRVDEFLIILETSQGENVVFGEHCNDSHLWPLTAFGFCRQRKDRSASG